MQLRLHGHLAWYEVEERSQLEIRLSHPVMLIQLLEQLQLPVAEIAVATVNGVEVQLQEARVTDEDRVDLYPPVCGGAAQSLRRAERPWSI